MKKLRFVLLIILAVSVLALAACGQDGEGAAEHKVDIMLDWYPNAVHSYLYVAQEKGFFEDEGVEVNIIFPANPTDPINMAAAGEITLGITYQPDVIMARANDVPVVSVAAIVRSPLNHIIMLDDSDIVNPKDLEGKTVGYPGIPVNEPLLQTMVEADGGDLSQVELIDIGFALGQSLTSGLVDAVIGAYINHEVPVLQHNGYDVRYFNPIDYGVPSFYELVIVTNETTWAAEEEGIRAFWRAAEKAYQFMKENPAESLDILFANQDQANFPLIREVEDQSLEILLSMMEAPSEKFGSQYEASWQETIVWLLEGGLIDEAPVIEDIFINIVE